ncbi:3-dehydroquinate dehydratase [Methanonatronarchaeum thermophilum]|uniref:3-dehydroquinate dehydratase n=1 Tax=Methanonatronarchaeum thermophilum TaxID=1927129 RepID=A0A1Y3GFV2_9EURY|nr:type I 3-dehydroquinate dehydratase [Methanonatronarchaeum thermophilum]OUJ18335.1 3-dehydroquinate dehydratase [Methanonatronarchaeum thermophilum]
MRPTASKPVSTGDIEIGEKPVICASIGEKTVEKQISLYRAVEADLVELRIDKLSRDSYGKLSRALSSDVNEKPLIITNRREKEGGEYDGPEKNRVEDLLSMMRFADIVDIELQTPQQQREKIIDKANEKGTPVIVSHHNHQQTTDKSEIKMKIEECMELGDIAKVAYMAKTPLDVLSLMEATYTTKKEIGKPVCSIAMGETGKHSRVIGPAYGSDIIYAPVGAETAPGQISLDKIKVLLRELF